MASKKFIDRTALINEINASEHSVVEELLKGKPAEPAPAIVLKDETLSQRVQLLVKPSTKKKLNKIATQNHISFNKLVNKVLENYINSYTGGNN